MRPELAKLLLIAREKLRAPRPVTQGEKDYLAVTSWGDFFAEVTIQRPDAAGELRPVVWDAASSTWVFQDERDR